MCGRYCAPCALEDVRLAARLKQTPDGLIDAPLVRDLAAGLRGRSNNPSALLYDALQHPGVDRGLQQLLLPPPPPTPPHIPAAQSDDTFTVHALNLDCCRTGGEVPAVDAAGIQSTQRILTSLSACQTACQADPTCTYISFAQVWSNCLLCTGCSLNACCGGTSYVSYRRQLGTG